MNARDGRADVEGIRESRPAGGWQARSAPPHVLEDGALVVPASLTPQLLVALQQSLRAGGLPQPAIAELAEACGRAATVHRGRQARLEHLERCAASAVATPAVLSMSQAGPPSDHEVSVAELSRRAGLSAQRIRQLAYAVHEHPKAGGIQGRRVGGCWWFTGRAVEDFLKGRTDGSRYGGTTGRRAA